MSGHMFVVQGDVRRLACDAWLMPCDAAACPDERWLLPDRPLPRQQQPPADWKDGSRRVREVNDWPVSCPQPWLVHVEGSREAPVAWYIEGVRQFLDAVRSELPTPECRFRRHKPLVAVPLVGADDAHAGEILTELVGLLQNAVRAHDHDIALVV